MISEFPSHVELTEGARRAWEMAGHWSVRSENMAISPQAVLMGLLSQAECRAAAILRQCGITLEVVHDRWPELCLNLADAEPSAIGDVPTRTRHPLSPEMQSSVDLAVDWLAEHGQPLELASEHLLWGLVLATHQAAQWLAERGVTADVFEKELCRLHGRLPDWMQTGQHEPLGDPIDLEDEGPGEEVHWSVEAIDRPEVSESRMNQSGVLRVIDAASNRAREALRVLEDYVRFVLDDGHLTEQFKRLRHELTEALAPIALEYRLASRETLADVGTDVSTEDEHYRDRPETVVAANFSRLQESLRTLEEFLKLIDSRLAVALEQLRYRVYTLQRASEITRIANERLGASRLYVLLDGRDSVEDFQRVAQDLVLAGVDVVQLRDKGLDDRALLQWARLLREITRGSGTLFAMNDRPDLALLARADAVHVGQEELAIKDVRQLVGPGMLIGASVHSLDQARSAVLDGADYLGVGPTFASETKAFEHYPGVELLRAVAHEISLPAFAIGGITRENLADVLATGMWRVAVSSAVLTANKPAQAAVELKAMLD